MSAPVVPLLINGIGVVEMHRLQDQPRVWACTMADGSLIVADGEHLADLIRAGWPTEQDVDPYERHLAPVVDIPELLPVPAGTASRNLQAYAVLGAAFFVLGLAWLLLPGGAA